MSKYIERCIDSVINQTYKNIECIFIDDCSPDNSIDIINKRLSSYTGNIDFKIIHHTNNKGLSGARNSGIKESTGEYLYFLDSDDEITHNCIEILTNNSKKFSNTDIVQGSANIIDKDTTYNYYLIKDDFPDYSDNHLWIKKIILETTTIPVTSWNKLINKTFLINNNLWFKEGIIHEDIHWFFFVAKHITTISFCKTITYLHYINEGSIITSDKMKSITCRNVIVDELIKNIDCELAKNQRQMIYKFALSNMEIIINYKTDNKTRTQSIITLRSNLKPLRTEACRNFRIFELLILEYFFLPMWIIKILTKKQTKGLQWFIVKHLI